MGGAALGVRLDRERQCYVARGGRRRFPDGVAGALGLSTGSAPAASPRCASPVLQGAALHAQRGRVVSARTAWTATFKRFDVSGENDPDEWQLTWCGTGTCTRCRVVTARRP